MKNTGFAGMLDGRGSRDGPRVVSQCQFSNSGWLGSRPDMWTPTDSLPMTGAQKQTLEAWRRVKTSPQWIVRRSRICLPAAEGRSRNAMALA